MVVVEPGDLKRPAMSVQLGSSDRGALAQPISRFSKEFMLEGGRGDLGKLSI